MEDTADVVVVDLVVVVAVLDAAAVVVVIAALVEVVELHTDQHVEHWKVQAEQEQGLFGSKVRGLRSSSLDPMAQMPVPENVASGDAFEF